MRFLHPKLNPHLLAISSTGVSDPSALALTASDAPEGPPLIASVSP